MKLFFTILPSSGAVHSNLYLTDNILEIKSIEDGSQITLINGQKLLVKDSVDEIKEQLLSSESNTAEFLENQRQPTRLRLSYSNRK